MTTWKTGRRIVADRLTARAVPLDAFIARIAEQPPARVPGSAVFMTAQPRGAPAALGHNVRYNKVLHQYVVILMVTTRPVPHVPDEERYTVRDHGGGVFELILCVRLHGGSRRAGGAHGGAGARSRHRRGRT